MQSKQSQRTYRDSSVEQRAKTKLPRQQRPLHVVGVLGGVQREPPLHARAVLQELQEPRSPDVGHAAELRGQQRLLHVVVVERRVHEKSRLHEGKVLRLVQ